MSDQGEEWVWASDWATDHDSFGNRVITNITVHPMSGTPQIASLPKCLTCQTNEVKPGEDQCWECLGEVQEPEQSEWITGSGIFYGNHTTTFPLITINGRDLSKEIQVIEDKVKALELQAREHNKPWWKRLWDWKL